MRLRNSKSLRTILFVATLSLLLNLPVIHAQQASQKKPVAQDEDVLHIKTELVQTDLMVFDKQGRFVEGLRPDQFELSLDGKAQTIAFFERVTSGSASEAAQVAASRSGSLKSREQGNPSVPAASNRGRVIFFFLDDLHLSEA